MSGEKVDSQLIGAAGEHLVLSRLLAKGILAAQAPRGVRKADILVNHLDKKGSSLVQVKTRSGRSSDGGWTMQSKHEDIRDKDMFYCFVDLEREHPAVYVIPATVVAKVVKESHANWLARPGKNGKAHKDSEMRRIRASYAWPVKSAPEGWMESYLENWKPLEA